MKKAAADTILLCALRFWALDFSRLTPTLRRGVRHVARKQGVRPAELDKAERRLVRRGFITKPRPEVIALTPKGLKVATRACRRVPLPPWNPQERY